MSKASSTNWSTSSSQQPSYHHQQFQDQRFERLPHPPRSLTQGMHNQRRDQSHQQYFLDPLTANPLTSCQQGIVHQSQQQLSLEILHDQLNQPEYTGLDSLTYSTAQSDALGIGQGPGNAEPRYTAPTATALAAHAHSHSRTNTFMFGHDVDSPQTSNTSPRPISSTSPFSTSFSFVASPPGNIGSHIPDVRENIPPHDHLTSHPPHYSSLQEYIQRPHSKRHRVDLYQEGSGDEDDPSLNVGTSYGYNGFGFTSLNVQSQSPEFSQSSHLNSSAQASTVTDAAGHPNHQIGPDGRPKQACVRCKNLKVRCEFTTDPHSCKRCLNGGHECAIPGRKKRRQPPKREHLLNKIREQAGEIEQLMKQVEDLRRRAIQEPPRLSLSNTPLTTGTGQTSASGNSTTLGPDLQAWLDRSRAVFEELYGLIELETAEDDGEGEDENSYREKQYESEDEGSISVEDPDGILSSPDLSSVSVTGSRPREASPASTVRSASREGSAVPQSDSAMRKRGSGKTPRLAPLPSTAAEPMKLIAQLSLRSDGNRERGSKSPRSTSGTIISSRSSSAEPTSASVLSITSPTLSDNLKEEAIGDNTEKPKDEGEENSFGAAAPEFFVAQRGGIPGPTHLAPARHPIPHILLRNIINVQEVETLFNIYFEKMNLSCSLLDPVLYSSQTTYWRSPFLFTVICAVASRYYKERSGLYEQLITYAQLAAGTALISGPKNVETVSAFILLSLYPIPMRRWEEDRTWLYLGLAIRVATDLNLHHQVTIRPRNEMHARELLNRTRVWINCYNLDRSTSSWLGKRSTIPPNDFVGSHAQDWYDSSEFNMENFDIHLAGYNTALRLLEEFKRKIYTDPNNPTGMDKKLDLSALSSEYDEKLLTKETEWAELLQKKTDATNSQARFRNSLLRLAYRYSRLVVLSFGFQYSFDKDNNENQDQTSFFDRCYRAATEILRVFVEELSAQKIYISHGPEAQCVFVTFASAFLIKLLHPKYAGHLKSDQRYEIDKLVRNLIELLGSSEVVVDDRHSPKLWSRFLSGLLSTPFAKIELSDELKKDSSSSRRGLRKSVEPPPENTENRTLYNSSALGAPVPLTPNTKIPYSSQNIVPSLQNTSSEHGDGYFDPTNSRHVADSRYSSENNQTSNHEFNAHPGLLNQDVPLGLPEVHGEYHIPPHSALQNDYPSRSTGVFDMQSNLSMNSLQMDPAYFQPPLQLDSDLLRSMQSMPDSTLCQYMPGFSWMGTLPPADTDANMQDVFTLNHMDYNTTIARGVGNRY